MRGKRAVHLGLVIRGSRVGIAKITPIFPRRSRRRVFHQYIQRPIRADRRIPNSPKSQENRQMAIRPDRLESGRVVTVW